MRPIAGQRLHTRYMSDPIPERLSAFAARQENMITRKQAINAGMSTKAIEWKLHKGQWRQVHRGVYATFTGPLSRTAELWAAVLYAGRDAMLSHETAGEFQQLVDKPASAIHITVPTSRRVTPVPGMVIHLSDQAMRLPSNPWSDLPMTLAEDTVIDLTEACRNVDDVYGWVTRAYGRQTVKGSTMMALAVQRRKKLRWRTELNEAIVAGAGGAHSALELRWGRDVERAHGLPASTAQVKFRKQDGQPGRRDRVYAEWGVIVELDGKMAHPEEERGTDRARDNQAAEEGSQTLRYGWRETRYEACETAVQVVKVLWRRGWQGQPKPCSPGCPMGQLLRDLDSTLRDLDTTPRDQNG